ERGDDDLLANGIILDWGGPGSGSGTPTAVNLARLTAQTPESPSVNLGALTVLAGLSGLALWRRARRGRAAVS
nr:hypothetical protein [Thermoflexales bacterium]